MISTFLSHLGLKESQYHQAGILHVCGGNYRDVTEAAVEGEVHVLRSSLLRRRILLAVEVLRILEMFQNAKKQWNRVEEMCKEEGAPNVSDVVAGAGDEEARKGPFSGIVEELRKSVGELQVRQACRPPCSRHYYYAPICPPPPRVP